MLLQIEGGRGRTGATGKHGRHHMGKSRLSFDEELFRFLWETIPAKELPLTNPLNPPHPKPIQIEVKGLVPDRHTGALEEAAARDGGIALSTGNKIGRHRQQ